MANKGLFKSAKPGRVPPAADTVNHAGGIAYAAGAQEALAQYVTTGCLSQTYYASAEEQLDQILAFAAKCDPEFVGKAAIYGRRSAFMKDAPALLLAHLTTRGDEGLAALRVAFPRVIDNPRMLRTFVQIMRSGRVGRKSLGTATKKLIQGWFGARSDVQLFRGSVGNEPSLADVVKMVHPKPSTESRKGLYAYLVGKPHDVAQLDSLVQAFEAWKLDPSREVPDVPFQMLTSAQLTKEQWRAIARQASWQTVRMNLNTFHRHGVFEGPEMVKLLADKLRDEREISRARVFPYQLLVAYKNTEGVPMQLQSALQDAMEIATRNVPVIEGRIAILPDVSSSMDSPVTGNRKGASTKVTCREVAALVAATLLRRNPDAIVLPFKEEVVRLRINPRDSIVSIAEAIAKCGSGGTNCSAPLRYLNHEREKLDMVIYVSDNESWVDSTANRTITDIFGRAPTATQTMVEWEALRARCPKAKLVCIDLAPDSTRQAPTRADIMNVGGFSDEVFTLISEFAQGSGKDHWVKKIESIDSAPAPKPEAAIAEEASAE